MSDPVVRDPAGRDPVAEGRAAWTLAWRLAWRTVTARPRRALLLCGGFGVGVGVMVVLLAVGEAMVRQASREQLVGGGQVTVLPEGIDLEVLTTGGLGGLYFSVPNARFVHSQVLAAPRLRDAVAVAAPQLEGKLLYLTTPDGVERPVRAAGELPSASRAVGALAPVRAGAWEDDDGDRRWAAPTPPEWRHDLDRFHRPPPGMAHPETWGEWHYFNVRSADGARWVVLSFLVGGDVNGTRWGGQLLATVHERGRPVRRYQRLAPRAAVRFDTASADLAVGDGRVRVLADGRYAVAMTVPAADGGAPLRATLTVAPVPHAEFPGATLLSGATTSGYVVPALRATATGTVCAGARCEAFTDAPAYHDHNWGGWRGVSWEWGMAQAGDYTLLYGRVTPEAGEEGSGTPLFAYLVDAQGFLALFRPKTIRWEGARTVATAQGPLAVPARATLVDARDGDTLSVTLVADDAIATDTRRPDAGRGAPVPGGSAAASAGMTRALARPWFVQMAGTATITGRVRGVPLAGSGRGFFETYR